MEKFLCRTRLAWYLYDWANSAFVTSVITVFLGPYLSYLAGKVANPEGYLNFWGLNIYSESLFSYTVSFSVVLQIFILPFIASIADLKNLKKLLLYLFAYLGSFATILLFFLSETTIILGCILFIFANVFFGASIVMYNSLLLDISTKEDRDKVSSIGWAFGYIGGGILLGINLLIVFFHSELGISNDEAIRISIVSAGFWWLLFSLLSNFYMKLPSSFNEITKEKYNISSLKKLFTTFIEFTKNKNALFFFFAYLFYNDGVQTVIIISTQFGRRELNLSMEFLVLVILIVQFLSFLGTLIIMKIDSILKTKRTLVLCILIWNLIVIYAFLFLNNEIGFLVLALLISLVLGGTQALSRSMFSSFIPRNCEAEYFSFYEITEKGSSWVGPLAFGLILQLTKSYRFAILSLILFFLFGLFFLIKVKFSSFETGELK